MPVRASKKHSKTILFLQGLSSTAANSDSEGNTPKLGEEEKSVKVRFKKREVAQRVTALDRGGSMREKA